jgi:hypothetical protein
MPINGTDVHYRSFQHEVVPLCLAEGIGILGMKSLGGGSPQGHIPTSADVSAQDGIHYALTQPISSLVIGIISMDHLKQNVALAHNFTPIPKCLHHYGQGRPGCGPGTKSITILPCVLVGVVVINSLSEFRTPPQAMTSPEAPAAPGRPTVAVFSQITRMTRRSTGGFEPALPA